MPSCLSPGQDNSCSRFLRTDVLFSAPMSHPRWDLNPAFTVRVSLIGQVELIRVFLLDFWHLRQKGKGHLSFFTMETQYHKKARSGVPIVAQQK